MTESRWPASSDFRYNEQADRKERFHTMPDSSFKKQMKRALRWLGASLLVILFTSTRISTPGSVTPWPEALETAAIQWIVWLVAMLVIIQFDKRLPVSRDALLARVLFHVPSSLLMSVFTTYLSDIAVKSVIPTNGPYPTILEVLGQSWRNGFYTHVMIYWAIIGIYMAYEYHQRLIDREVRTARLEKLVSESQLHALRSQLHPHFLFNTLNAISAYVERNPRIARSMLEQLGTLLRLSLEHANDQEIPLSQEIAFIGHYLDLQKVRFEGRLSVKIEVDAEVMGALVPTFVLQPLVENAIRHGTALRSEMGLLEVGGYRRDSKLVVTVQDNGPGLPSAWSMNRDAGIGISNTRERLRCLYDDNQSFEISAGHDGCGVLARLSIPFHCADPVSIGLFNDEYSCAGG